MTIQTIDELLKHELGIIEVSYVSFLFRSAGLKSEAS